MRNVMVVLLGMYLAVLACLPSPIAYVPLKQPTTEDPDALYAATIRVFLRKGWGFQSRDPQARAVETKWFDLATIGITQTNTRMSGMFRVIVDRGSIEIFTDCGEPNDKGDVDDDHRCPRDTRPAGISDQEQRLVGEIIEESRQIAPGQAVRDVGAPSGPPPPPMMPVPVPAPAMRGCTKDTDCKGDRVCEGGACTSPAPRAP